MQGANGAAWPAGRTSQGLLWLFAPPAKVVQLGSYLEEAVLQTRTRGEALRRIIPKHALKQVCELSDICSDLQANTGQVTSRSQQSHMHAPKWHSRALLRTGCCCHT